MISDRKIQNFILALLGLAAFAWGFFYKIHSSEFWSISVSKYTFDPSYLHTTLIKPIFHFILSLVYFLPLNNVEHLLLVKFFFSIIGAAQILLFFLLVFHFSQKRFFSCLATASLCLSPIYLENFFRVRADQVSITLFLLFLLLKAQNKITTKKTIFFAILYPAIAAKGILFSLLTLLIQIDWKSLKTKKPSLNVILIAITALVWLLNFQWESLLYLKESYASFFDNMNVFKIWLKSDYFVFIPLIFLFSKNNTNKKQLGFNPHLLSLFSILLILIISQKFSFFIASFIPIFYLSFWYFVYSRFNLKFTQTKIKIALLGFVALQYAIQFKNLSYPSNQPQMKFIGIVADLVDRNNLSYMDGFSMMPRSTHNSQNCFVSPDDSATTDLCLKLISDGKPDSIILTQRLLSVIKNELPLLKNYKHYSHNIYVKHNIEIKGPLPQPFLPSLIVFGFE